jgi:hypothetical protein
MMGKRILRTEQVFELPTYVSLMNANQSENVCSSTGTYSRSMLLVFILCVKVWYLSCKFLFQKASNFMPKYTASESKLLCDWRSVSQSVLALSPFDMDFKKEVETDRVENTTINTKLNLMQCCDYINNRHFPSTHAHTHKEWSLKPKNWI